MAGHTAAYDEFMYSFNGGPEYKDDLDLDAYGRCTPTEKAELDRLLEKKLHEGDPRVGRAIQNLWPEEKAAAVLTRTLANSDGEARLGIATALRAVSEQAALDALRSALFDESATAEARVTAAVALAQIDGAPASFSLKAALDAPVPALQRRAAELLFQRLKLDEQAANDSSGAAVLQCLLRDDDERVRQAAVTELKRVVDSGSAAVAGYRGGAIPPQLADLAVRAGNNRGRSLDMPRNPIEIVQAELGTSGRDNEYLDLGPTEAWSDSDKRGALDELLRAAERGDCRAPAALIGLAPRTELERHLEALLMEAPHPAVRVEAGWQILEYLRESIRRAIADTLRDGQLAGHSQTRAIQLLMAVGDDQRLRFIAESTTHADVRTAILERLADR